MTIEELLKTISVVEVIQRKFNLRKCGYKYYKGIEHDSLVINTEENKFYWNSQGISGGPLDWLLTVEGLSMRSALKVLNEVSGLPVSHVALIDVDRPPPILQSLINVFYDLGKFHRGYWYNRGFTDQTIDKFKLGYTGNAHVIPIVYNGVLDNFQCRIGAGVTKKVWWWSRRKPALFNSLATLNSDYVILTEGSIDAITLDQLGFPAISANCLNYWDNAWNKHIIKTNAVYVLYDNDTAGNSAGAKIVKRLLNRGRLVLWPNKYMEEKDDVNKLFLRLGQERASEFIRSVLLPCSIDETMLNVYDTIDRFERVTDEAGKFFQACKSGK